MVLERSLGTPAQFHDALTKHSWRVIADVQPPAKGGGNWTFRGVSLQGASEGLVLELGTAKPSFFLPWKPAKRVAPMAPVRAQKHGWVTVGEIDAVKARGRLEQPIASALPHQQEFEGDTYNAKARPAALAESETSFSNLLRLWQLSITQGKLREPGNLATRLRSILSKHFLEKTLHIPQT